MKWNEVHVQVHDQPPKSVNSTSPDLLGWNEVHVQVHDQPPPDLLGPVPQNQWTQPPPDLLGWNEVHVQGLHNQPPQNQWAQPPPDLLDWVCEVHVQVHRPTPQNQWTRPSPDLLGWNEVHVQVHHQPPKISELNLRLTCWAETTYMNRYTTNPPKSVNSTSTWLIRMKWGIYVQVHDQPPKISELNLRLTC